MESVTRLLSGRLCVLTPVLSALLALSAAHSAYAVSTFIPAPNRVDIMPDPIRHVLYITSGAQVLRYDLQTQQFLAPFQLGGNLIGMDLSPDGNTLAVADNSIANGQDWIHLVNLQTGTSQKVTFDLGFYEGGTWTVAYGNDGNILITSTFLGSGWVPLRKLNPATTQTTTLYSVRQDTMLSSSGDGSVIGFAEANISDGRWGRYRVSDGDLVERTFSNGTGWFNFEIGTNHNGTQFAIPTFGGTFIYDSNFNKITTLGQYAGPQPIGVAYHPLKDEVYFPWEGTAEVRAFNTTTFAQVAAYNVGYTFQFTGNHAFQEGHIRIARDGSMLFVTVGGGVSYVALPTSPSPPGAATLVSPSGNVNTSTPTYLWNAVANATWYYLWVNDSATATGRILQWYTTEQAGCAGGGTCAVTPSTPLAAGAAQWWIQTWNTNGYGPWSSGKAFTVDIGGPPGKATLKAPSGNVTTTTPSYVWNAVANATWYQLWVSDSAASPKIQSWYTAGQLGCDSGSGTCSVTPDVALASGQCEWWIQTWNSSGYGPWSDGLAFAVSDGGPPGKATLNAPSGNASTTTPSYVWNAVANATWYQLWVNDSSASPKIQAWYTAEQAGCDSGSGACSITPDVPLAPGQCQWWIQTWNDSGYGPWSDPLSFNVSASASISR